MTPDKLLQYTLGIPELDAQHQGLIKDLDNLREAFNQRHFDLVPFLLLDLHKKLIDHFISEENVMLRIKYPSLEDHRFHHRSILDLVDSLILLPHTEDTRGVTIQGLTLALIEHIRIHDIAIASFYHNAESFSKIRFQVRPSQPASLM